MVGTFLRRLKFKHRMFLPAGVSTLALLGMLVMVRFAATRNSDLLDRVETRYAPALEASRDLEELLASIQRDLQDAVAAEDAGALAEVDGLDARFRSRLAEAEQNPAFGQGPSSVADLYRAYYGRARATAQKLVERRAGDDVTAELRDMTERYNALRTALAATTAAERGLMARAFLEVREVSARSNTTATVVILIAVALALALTVWIVASMSRPLDALTAAARRIAAEGDLTQEVPVESDDEVGILAASFRSMVERLRSILGTLKSSSEALVAAAGRLSETVQSQTVRMQQQAAGIAEASATTRQLEQAASLAASQAEAVLAVAREAAGFSETGQSAADASLGGIGQLRDQVTLLLQKSAGLSEKTREVGEIIESVKDIADVSRILSLNASIEAARAGEAGRGFAVVAGEVRALAERTSQSAGHIALILKDIQSAVQASAEISQRGKQDMDRSLDQVRASGEALARIGAIVKKTTDSAMQIASAVKQQSVGFGQISTAVGDIDAGMQDTVRGIGTLDHAAAELNQTATRISAIVKEFRA